jgi:hypothetical protein
MFLSPPTLFFTLNVYPFPCVTHAAADAGFPVVRNDV